jgi:hypothetical protein
MLSQQIPKSPASRGDIFREQAIDAWRRHEEESHILLDLSPRWMRWALVGVFALAATGLLIAANTTVASRVMGPAVVQTSASGDSLIVEAFFPARAIDHIFVGQPLSFRPSGSSIGAVALEVSSVAPLASSDGPAVGHSASAPDPRAEASLPIVVYGGALVSRLPMKRSPAPGSGGTAQLVIGRESLLHLLRPRTSNQRSGRT